MPRPPKNQSLRLLLTKAELEAMVDKATVDAYGEEEQRTGFFTMIEEHLKLPF